MTPTSQITSTAADPTVQRSRRDFSPGRARMPTYRPIQYSVEATDDGTLDLAGITRIDRTQFHAERRCDGLGRAELRRAGRDGSFAKDRHSCYAGGNLFKQFQPFSGDGIFEDGKAGGVAARVRQAIDVASPDRVSDKRKHNRHGARCL
jgi:hypothetical protein